MTDMSESILVCLRGTSKKYPMKRKDVCAITGLSDRKMRGLIAQLQLSGHPIVSLQSGYFFGNAQEVNEYKLREMSRAFSLLKKLKKMFPDFDEMSKQLKLKL